MSDPWKSFRPRRLWARVVVTQVALLLALAVMVGGFAAVVTRLEATADVYAPSEAVLAELAAHRLRVEETQGHLEVTRLQLERATEVIRYSGRYRIPADLSAAIYDIALAEGIHPALGFELVRVESRFSPGARSTRGAIGYTQIRLPTARGYDPKITAAELHKREVNLRLGFRYFRDLMTRFGTLDLALLAYNRGPTIVDSIVSAGGDPGNGYAETVKRGLSRAATARPTTGS